MTFYLRWATSEAEAIELQAQGWKLASKKITHHSAYSILLRREFL